MGALQWRKISILIDPKQNSVVSKNEKQKKVLCPVCYATGVWGPLGFDLVACTTFTTFPFLVHYGGPDFVGGGPENNILGGPCQQLLTLLTLKSATVTSSDF